MNIFGVQAFGLALYFELILCVGILNHRLFVEITRASDARRKAILRRFIIGKLFLITKVSTKHELNSYNLYSISHEMTLEFYDENHFSSCHFHVLIHFLCKSTCRCSAYFFMWTEKHM